MKYLKKNIRLMILLCIVITIFNLYFIFLIPNHDSFYIYYIDILIIVCLFLVLGIDYSIYRRKQKIMKEMLTSPDIIYSQIDMPIDQEVFEHDLHILQSQINEQFQINCDLQDYIVRWCHEMKLPLSALFLMNEKIDDPHTRLVSKEQLERMRQQLNSALIGARIQSQIYDLQIQATNLEECVKASIKNNQFFFIQKHFTLETNQLDKTVYTDKQWLVYVLDQLFSNAIKYSKESPILKIEAKKVHSMIQLSIEDQGMGIKDSDIRRVFEKGFTGSNQHNGQYKSTGMGLYLVKTIIDKLGHTIIVESEYEKFARFTISFQDNREYFYL